MKEKREIIYLDEEGYSKYIEEIKETKEELAKIKASKHDAYNATSSNSLGDNFDFEETERLEVMLLGQLKRKIEGLQDIIIITEEGKKEDSVNLNDCVELSLFFKISSLVRMPFDSCPKNSIPSTVPSPRSLFPF